MSAHTKGPWGCKRSETGPWAIFGADGSWIATTCKKQWKDEDIANARLIAAAPELLDALVAIVNAWEHGAEFGSNEIGNARKAIAKAEGKQ